MYFPGNARLQPGAYYRTRGYLPHLDLPEAIQHVTYHLADSLPQEVLVRMKKDWNRQSREEGICQPEKCQAGAWRSGERRSDRQSIWHREYWDRFIRDVCDFETVVNYIHENPVKAGLAAEAGEWLWSSAGKSSLARTIEPVACTVTEEDKY